MKKNSEAAAKEKAEKQRPFEIEKQTLRGSHFKRMTADDMLAHVQAKVFPFQKNINGHESSINDHMKTPCS